MDDGSTQLRIGFYILFAKELRRFWYESAGFKGEVGAGRCTVSDVPKRF